MWKETRLVEENTFIAENIVDLLLCTHFLAKTLYSRLNQIFFPDLVLEGQEVFATSNSSGDSCTSGIWAAFEPHMQTLVLDTEGMLGMSAKDYANGITANENRRTRQLLKILAISDIVIYKTRYTNLIIIFYTWDFYSRGKYYFRRTLLLRDTYMVSIFDDFPFQNWFKIVLLQSWTYTHRRALLSWRCLKSIQWAF